MADAVYISRRVRLPEFLWQALAVLTEYSNEQAGIDPEEEISVSGLIEILVLTSIKTETLRAIAESSPEFQEAIAAWVGTQIERDPRAMTVFSLPVWSFARRAN